jgi:hypothetical protein
LLAFHYFSFLMDIFLFLLETSDFCPVSAGFYVWREKWHCIAQVIQFFSSCCESTWQYFFFWLCTKQL